MATRRSSARKNSGPLAFIAKLIRAALVLTMVALAIGVGYGGAMTWYRLRDLPDVALVERYEPIEAIQLYDRNDHLICTVEGDEDRRIVPLNQVSPQMQQAMLAAEDHHFYEHHGINFMSIVRAMLANLQAHRVVEGGSTITQQLVKNLFFGDKGRTFDRKVKEAFLAAELERRYSKERILEMYLNQVYFGNNAYGIERAASRYFDEGAAELNLAQAAFLAGLVKAPSELGSQSNRQEAIARQHEILDKMVEYGYIMPAQAKAAMKLKLEFKKGANPLQRYPYYVSYVLEQLRDRFSQAEMRKQGLRVYTNLDPEAEEIAEKTLETDIKKAPKGLSQAALVTVSVADGAVLAMVGGVGNFWKHQFNRATNPHTAGSSFKPFVYLTAFEKGALTPDSLIEDTPLVVHSPWGLPDYAPKNFDKRFYGKIPVRLALALSRNVCSVRIAQLVGIDNVVETARLAGVTSKLEPNLSLALGSSAVTPLDMAGAYATFARMGVAIKPQVLRRIENNRGQVIEVFQPAADKVFAVEPVARLVDVLQDVVKKGTGTQARLKDRPVAGKTGTADAGRDIWFIGFTPDMVTAVWGGNDENHEIPGQHVTGGDVMARIWRDYATAYYVAHPTPPGQFVPPSGAVIKEEKKEQPKPEDAGEKLVKGGDTTESIKPIEVTPSIDNQTQPPVQESAETQSASAANGAAALPGGSPESSLKINGAPVAGESKTPTPAPLYQAAPQLRGYQTQPQTQASTAPQLHPYPIAPQTAPSLKTAPASAGPTVFMTVPPSKTESVPPVQAIPATGTSAPTRLYPYSQSSKYAPVNP